MNKWRAEYGDAEKVVGLILSFASARHSFYVRNRSKTIINTSPRIQTLPDTVQNTLLSAFMKLASRLGWEVTAVDDLGVHLRKKKTYGSGYLLVGALTAIIIIGLLVWIVGLLDYLASSDRILFIPHQDLTNESALKTADLLL